MSEAERPAAPHSTPKEDPETLVLRGRPRPVIRFRRGLIIGVSGIATAALIGLAWVALEPPSFRLAGGADAAELASRAAPDGIADAPASYADVPQPRVAASTMRVEIHPERRAADFRGSFRLENATAQAIGEENAALAQPAPQVHEQ